MCLGLSIELLDFARIAWRWKQDIGIKIYWVSSLKTFCRFKHGLDNWICVYMCKHGNGVIYIMKGIISLKEI